MNAALPPLLVRADADAVQGTGHVMRCLALAHRWRERGGLVRFLSHRPGAALRRRMQLAGATMVELEARHPDQRDLSLSLALIRQLAASAKTPPWIVVDGYHFDPEYQQQLRQSGARVLVIDDNDQLSSYHADVILNHGLHAGQLEYRGAQDAWLLLGTRYAMLRREFDGGRGFRRHVKEAAHHLLVTLGGGDSTAALAEIVAALWLVGDQDLQVRVVAGPLQSQGDTLQGVIEQAGNIHIETAVSNMAELMAWADVAIAAGGTTAWELAFMQTPTLLIAIADNQIGVAQSLDEFGAATFLGPVGQLAAPEIAVALRHLLADGPRRRLMARRGAELVDGRGAERVIDALMTRSDFVSGDGFWLRPADAEDKLLLWQWANDPAVRRNSFNPAAIPWDDHEPWFANKLASPHCRLWIMHLGAVPVGQIRYERIGDDVAELSYAIAPGFRGMRLGTQLLKSTAELAGRELGVGWVRGIAFADNPASQRAMINAGFEAATWQQIDGRDCVVLQRRCVSPWSREFHVAVH